MWPDGWPWGSEQSELSKRRPRRSSWRVRGEPGHGGSGRPETQVSKRRESSGVSELLRVEFGEDGDWPLDLATWESLVPST